MKSTVHFKYKGFGMDVESITIVKNGITIELSGSDWKELNAVFDGKRKSIHTSIEPGTYYPSDIINYNY